MDSRTIETKKGLFIEPNKIAVSDREILKVIKEEKKFPIQFSRRVKLATLINYYNKYWSGDFTDDDSETD